MGNQIYQAMVGAMSDIGAIAKGRTNTQQGFKFRGIDDIYNELHDILAKHKIFTIPEVMSERTEERTTRNGGALIYRVLDIRYTFYHEDGSSVSCNVIGEGMDSGDKAANKAMSIAHKYALLQAFIIPTEDEKDPDSQSHDVAPKTDSTNEHGKGGKTEVRGKADTASVPPPDVPKETPKRTGRTMDDLKLEMAKWFEEKYHDESLQKFKEMTKGVYDNPLTLTSIGVVSTVYKHFLKFKEDNNA